MHREVLPGHAGPVRAHVRDLVARLFDRADEPAERVHVAVGAHPHEVGRGREALADVQAPRVVDDGLQGGRDGRRADPCAHHDHRGVLADVLRGS